MGALKDKTIHGVMWSVMERLSVQGIQFLVMIVIARILSPSDYGLVGMLAIFIAVAESLINSGFSQALIRKQDCTDTDNSTVFYFNIAVSVVLYALLYWVAPWVSNFYSEPQLCAVMRVICLIVIINSFGVVQRAILTAQIDFRTQAKASVVAASISGIVGIWLACSGYGVWTLVYQQLINATLNIVILWRLSLWRPKLVYSWLAFKQLFTFGSKLMLSGLLDTVYNNLFQLIIGKVFSANSLGCYSRAHHFAEFPSSNMTCIIQRVTYPVLCSIQDEDERLALNYRKILKLSAFVMFPMMMGLAALSFPFIEVLLGAKWHLAGTLLIPVCFSKMWYPINSINLNLLQVKGRSDLLLKLEIIKKIMGVAVLTLSVPFGLIAMCYSTIASTLISVVINTYYTGKLIDVGFVRQMRDLMPTLSICLVMFAAIWMFTSIIENDIIRLSGGVVLGTLFFLLVTYVFRFSELEELKLILRKK